MLLVLIYIICSTIIVVVLLLFAYTIIYRKGVEHGSGYTGDIASNKF